MDAWNIHRVLRGGVENSRFLELFYGCWPCHLPSCLGDKLAGINLGNVWNPGLGMAEHVQSPEGQQPAHGELQEGESGGS